MNANDEIRQTAPLRPLKPVAPDPLRTLGIDPAPAPGEGLLLTAEPQVQTRIRVSHDYLAKEGWRYETTVEVEFTGIDADGEALARIEALVESVGKIGAAERDRRNAERVPA